jgi:hypothetical protein
MWHLSGSRRQEKKFFASFFQKRSAFFLQIGRIPAGSAGKPDFCGAWSAGARWAFTFGGFSHSISIARAASRAATLTKKIKPNSTMRRTPLRDLCCAAA